MSTVLIEPQVAAKDVLPLVKDAVKAEIVRLELAIETALKRLASFETKYRVTSAEFIEHMTAEDLEGGDDEYVMWAGEYKLLERLRQKCALLKGLRFGDNQ